MTIICADDVHLCEDHMSDDINVLSSQTEMAHALHWYHTCGLAPTLPTETQARGLHALTNGNAKEVRLLTPKLTLLSSGRV